MKNSLETRLGVFFALVVIGAFILFEMIGGASFFHRGKDLRAYFDSVRELKVGDPVKLAGVMVGRVDDIRLATNKVEVVMRVNRDATVRTDSIAAVQFTGLMGQNFVSLTFGTASAPVAEAGAVLSAKDQPDLSQLMEKLQGVADGMQNMTKSFSGEEFTKLLGPFTDFLKDNNTKLASIFGNMQNISSAIAEGKGTLGRLINDDSVYTNVVSMMTNLTRASGRLDSVLNNAEGLLVDARSAVGTATNVLAGIQRGDGTMGKLLHDETLYKETTGAMTNLREIMQKINSGQGSVGKLVNDDNFLKNVKLTLQKVDKATEGLEDQGPLSIIGIFSNSLF